MNIQASLQWLHDLPLSEAIRTSSFLFPAIESVHVIAITLVIGSVAIVDLRLLGIPSHNKPFSELSNEVLPLTWVCFAIAALSGSLLFISNAVHYFANIPFRLKMFFMAAAGINMLVFELLTIRSVKHWDRDVPTLLAARFAGILSLILWILVVGSGRWIGFTISG